MARKREDAGAAAQDGATPPSGHSASLDPAAAFVPQTVGQTRGHVAPDMPAGYADLLERLKQDIRAARVRAAQAANRELLALYWRIGAAIVDRQDAEGWGSRALDRLAADLQAAFPGVDGFSRRNLYRMRAFYGAYRGGPGEPAPDGPSGLPAIVPQAVAQLPWGHNVILLEKLKDPALRAWYAERAVRHGWSRAVLELQLGTRLHEREGRAVTNFAATLPPPDSDLARQALKDPYVFDFLTLAADARERETERALVAHVERFLLELGAGFAFVGRQVHLDVGDSDFYVDLLFYHLHLRCYVVVELKAVAFRPEFAGQINFYCSVVDDRMRRPGDGPTIGLLLCKGKDRVVAEYALRDVHKPIGVADWEARLAASLPQELRGSLPTVEELERELGGGEEVP